MTKTRRVQISNSSVPSSVLPFHPWLLVALTALFVARPLVASEGVAWLGDGQPFCMLWLLLGLATALAALKAGHFPRPFGGVEIVLCLFVALHSAAAIYGATIGSPRPAINMLWEGIAMGMSFLLVRQLVQTPREGRALVAVMIALAVVLSTYGFYQVFIGLPADRAEYSRDPDGMLRRAGQWYAKGSPERVAFENRLRSSEPLATFALTNSLAGYLAPWLVIGVGIGLNRKRSRDRWVLLGVAIVITGCLVLTKSRSAYLATALGIALLGLTLLRKSTVWKWKPIGGALGTIAVVVGLAIFVKGLDAKVLTEAGKSFGYRLQYWKSTAVMIRDRPLLGVGPGNFQDFYTQYKLPEASEEIRDPHNWLFEIAATAGLPALMAFGVLMVIALLKLSRSKAQTVDESAKAPMNNWCVYGGAIVGGGVALVIGPLAGLPLGLERLIGGLAVGAAVIFLLNDWVTHGELSARLLAIGVVVMLVNLLAAGGILYPAVAGSMWLMLALGLNLVQARVLPMSEKAPKVALGPLTGFASCGLLVVMQYFTGYAPVLRSQAAQLEAQGAVDDAARYERMLTAAASADPRSADPWQELASFKLRTWLRRPGPRALREFHEASDRFLQLKPESSSAHRLVGNWEMQVFQKSNSPADASAAVNRLARAVELYPNNAPVRAELALAYRAAGEGAAVTAAAMKALELDAATPHVDKKLSADMRRTLAELARSR